MAANKNPGKATSVNAGDRPAGGPPAIRLATADDLPAIRALTTSAYARYRARMNIVPAPVRKDYQAELTAGQIWVLSPDETAPGPERRAIAGVIVLIEDGDSLLIENVAVRPSAQRTGLGRRLMEFAEQQARARGFSRLTLYTNEVMTENIAIYTHLGYRETSRAEQDAYRRVFMEKRLD